MEAAHREKRLEPKKPLEGTLEYDLYVSDLSQEIIELTEVVEEEPLPGEDRASATRKPVGPPEQVRSVQEKPDLGSQGRKNRSEPIARAIPPTVPVKCEDGPVKEPQPEMKPTTDEAFPAVTENRKPDAEHQGLENLEADRIFAEFFSSLDPEDLSEEVTETSGPFHRPIVEEPPRVEDDALEKLLGELESTELVVVKETSDSPPPAGEPVVTIGPREADWPWSDTRCSQRIVSLDKEIARYQDEMAKQISQLRVQQEELRRRCKDIESLLYATDDQLRSAVARIFRTSWKLQVSDLENRKIPGFKDDILVEHEGRKIIFKIKSTTSSHPPIKYVTELWQELHYSGLGKQAEAGLIFNYDIRNDPSERRLACTGGDEEYLEDIIFVDTRVLHDLTLAVAEYGLPLQSAKDLLLKRGRVQFHLDVVAG